MLRRDDAASLPLLYHLNSEPWFNFEAYRAAAYEPPRPFPARGRYLELPPCDVPSNLQTLLQARRSCRQFAERPLSRPDLAALLNGAYGVVGAMQAGNGSWALARPAPSAGALYPLEVYAATRRVEDIPDAVYRYAVMAHGLEPAPKTASFEAAAECVLTAEFLRNANCLLMLSAVFHRTLKKYGPRGYRYILLEAGHVAQNVCLLAAERGLSALCVGGFWDARLNALLGLDPREEAIVYCVAIGHPVQGASPDGTLSG